MALPIGPKNRIRSGRPPLRRPFQANREERQNRGPPEAVSRPEAYLRDRLASGRHTHLQGLALARSLERPDHVRYLWPPTAGSRRTRRRRCARQPHDGHGWSQSTKTPFQAPTMTQLKSLIWKGISGTPGGIRTPIARFAHTRHSLIARDSPSGSKPDAPPRPDGMRLPLWFVRECASDFRLRRGTTHESRANVEANRADSA